MIRLSIDLEHADAKSLMDDLWFLRELRQQEGQKKKSQVLDLVYQILSEQVAEKPNDEAWSALMEELRQKK